MTVRRMEGEVLAFTEKSTIEDTSILLFLNPEDGSSLIETVLYPAGSRICGFRFLWRDHDRI